MVTDNSSYVFLKCFITSFIELCQFLMQCQVRVGGHEHSLLVFAFAPYMHRFLKIKLKPLIILGAVYININEISNKNTNLADQVYKSKCIEKNCKSRGKLKFNVFSFTCAHIWKMK